MVAFFPRDVAKLARRDELASNAVSHFNGAIASAKNCLRKAKKSVQIEVVLDDDVTVEQNGQQTKVTPPKESSGVAVFLFDAKRKPCLVDGGETPTALTWILPSAGGQYYGVPACIEDESDKYCDGPG
jgi:hypothetical protein